MAKMGLGQIENLNCDVPGITSLI